jgi:energy-coupling factor transporter ATP-binding protein EcfA2
MTITRIKVENVKGASTLEINQQILPNKPSLMVAPNGFGKSSIATAFASLVPSKLKLDKDFFHKSNENLKPKLTLEIQRADGSIETLVADENGNTISSSIDVFVINSRLEAKATKRNMGGFTSASASLQINEIVLVDKIPERVNFSYKATDARREFGANGKPFPTSTVCYRHPHSLPICMTRLISFQSFLGCEFRRRSAI